MFCYVAMIFPAAQYASNQIGIGVMVPRNVDVLPLVVRVVLYLVVADLGHYWIHRLLHSAFFWRIHKWHHSPTHMSWAAGARVTFFDATIVNLAYVFAWPLLGTTSSDPAHFKKNLGSLLSVWDRLFGTYFDPDLTPAGLRFGLGEDVLRWRLVTGV